MSQPVAFLSYVREVDAMGDLTRFRESLTMAVRERGFDTFDIFHDRLHIVWGDDWRQRVLDSVDDVMLILPIISPGFLKSESCRFEIDAFIERDRQGTGRKSVILPVYFVNTPAFERPGPVEEALVSFIRQRKTYLDFRTLKRLPKDHIDYRSKIDEAADTIAAILGEPPAEPKPVQREAQAVAAVIEQPKPPRPRRKRAWIAAGLGLAAWLAGFGAYAIMLWPHPPPAPPALEAYEARCVVADTTQSFLAPDNTASPGPTLGAKRQLVIVGKVPGTAWVAARNTDERLFYFPNTACMNRLN